MSYNNQFLFLLDRERGREAVGIAFPQKDGKLGESILLTEFINKLQEAAKNLQK